MKKVLSMLLSLPSVTALAEKGHIHWIKGKITGIDELSTTTMAVPLGTARIRSNMGFCTKAYIPLLMDIAVQTKRQYH